MKFVALHPNFQLPTKGTDAAGGYDIYMPEAGKYHGTEAVKLGLGFKAAVPEGYVAMIVPRSSTGFKHGVEVNNTVGIIDSDYRGEWFVKLRTKNGWAYSWEAGDRVFQYILVPVGSSEPELVTELDETERGTGGLGSTGA